MTTLRDQRGCRSPLYSHLKNPIYITSPNALMPLLDNASFGVLPEEYQARTLDEAYNVRQTPFVQRGCSEPVSRKRRDDSDVPWYDCDNLSPGLFLHFAGHFKSTAPSPAAQARYLLCLPTEFAIVAQ
ncbi:hypothetical protein RhiJN_13957 [Ceratobasidium sp. AG-Ba]|nr:hypothetical protein RhiJN_13957 [Ceratobasidium sp. AG-Ba]QRW14516.1 hypothetical protein RhiLY_13515 [Ceratobasidium sp. AG-Ba]